MMIMEAGLKPLVDEAPAPSKAGTWDQRYQEEAYIFGTEPNAYLSRHAQLWSSGHSLLRC
jgi:hypothetical protein